MRPTIVVADDHPRVLQSVSSLLADDFDVVAAVTDGRQAIDAAGRLDPDIVLLDITMPVVDGLRAAQSLKRSGSRAKLVFLTLHAADEFVEAALATGAKGYVLKTRMEADLAAAIHHTLAGRTFVPSLASLSAVSPGSVHSLHVRRDEAFFFDEVATFLYAATRRGDMTAVIATEPIRAGIAGRLAAAGCDVAVEKERGRYIEWDATQSLSHVMNGTRPDRRIVTQFVEDLDRSRLAIGQGRPNRLAVFGEMSVLLLRDGNTEGAVAMEHTWNELSHDRPFMTVCSYPEDLLNQQGNPEVWTAVCAEHGSACHA
jgi:DNA-binding NarL/FixJ family response regulator